MYYHPSVPPLPIIDRRRQSVPIIRHIGQVQPQLAQESVDRLFALIVFHPPCTPSGRKVEASIDFRLPLVGDAPEGVLAAPRANRHPLPGVLHHAVADQLGAARAIG